MHRTGLLKTIWLSTRCIAYTAESCFRLNLVPHKKLTPLEADRRLGIWAHQLLKFLNASVTTHNPFNVTLEKNKRYIIMCNHTSLFDIPLSYIAFPNTTIRMLAKKELMRIPVFRQTMKKTRTPIINRHNREQAIKDMAHTKSLMNEGLVLWMAPEGTRSKTGDLQTFKKGGFITAIQAEATIIPLVIQHADKLYQRDIKRFNLNQQIEMTIGKPIPAKGYTLDEKDALRLKVHQEMKALLKQDTNAS